MGPPPPKNPNPPKAEPNPPPPDPIHHDQQQQQEEQESNQSLDSYTGAYIPDENPKPNPSSTATSDNGALIPDQNPNPNSTTTTPIETSGSAAAASVPYTIPPWSERPSHPFALEVLKDGAIIDQLDVYAPSLLLISLGMDANLIKLVTFF